MDKYLEHSVRRYPDRTALLDAESGETWTYSELGEWAGRIGNGLRERGISAGDRVALLMSRSPEAIAALWGVFRRGATLVPLNPDEPGPERQSRCERAGVELRIAGTETAEPVKVEKPAAIPTIEFETLSSTETERKESSSESDASERKRRIDETRVILFTSGTTGTPTGVRLTARNIGASAASTVARLGATTDDRWLLDLPIYHAGGLSIPIRTAMIGATTVLRGSFDASGTARTMVEFDVTGVSLVPTMLERLLDEQTIPASLGFALIGGAATPPSLVKRALDAEVPIYASYGMTETASGIATATPAELQQNPETVGRPVRAATVSIRGSNDQPIEAGKVGEIAVSGPIVSPGTIGGSERNPEDPLRTGDRGYLTAAGRLVVTGRIDDLIVTGGENVSPREVEAAIQAEASISAVSVLGLPDEEWGEQVTAAIVPDRNANAEQFSSATIRNRLRGRLADYKVPKTITFLESLPRTPSGTVDREALRERLGNVTKD